MKQKLGNYLAVFMLIVLLPAHVNAQDNLLSNGDFETGDFSGWNQLGSVGEAQAFVNTSNVESGVFAADVYLPAASTDPLLASQFQFGGSNLNDNSGQTYLLTFWYAVNLGTEPASSLELNARWDLTSLFSSTTQSTWGQDGTSYTEFSTLVTGSGNDNLVISMSNVGSDNTDIYLDNFSITPTPEPSTLALFSLAGASLVSYRFTRGKYKARAE
jgi:hypothetical protein